MWPIATLMDRTVLAGQPSFFKGSRSLINPVFVTLPSPAAAFWPPRGLSWCRQRDEDSSFSAFSPSCSLSPLQLRGRGARVEECGSAALELNDDRGPLECPQSPTSSASPVSLLYRVTDGPSFHQPGLSTLSLPAESEIFSGI